VIRTLIVDDHLAVRQGLMTLLRAEPGIVPVAAVDRPELALATAREMAVNCAMVDYNLGDEDGLELVTIGIPDDERLASSAVGGGGQHAQSIAAQTRSLHMGCPPKRHREVLHLR
jgi:DNA-binding NarL/FixJ family response regulator